MKKHVYISGIGGAGLFALAQLALDCGYRVSGSDLETGPHTDWLKNHGVTTFRAQDSTDISQLHAKQPIDWFIGTSALPGGHKELTFANRHGIKVSKRDEFIKQILQDNKLKLIAVSGTHGKTTTTGMLAWLFYKLNLPISYSIGTDISFGPSGHYAKSSQYFVYEADEFDRNFLAFKPYLSLLPAVEYDHNDTYPTLESYKEAFRQFVAQSHCSFMYKPTVDYLGLAEKGCLHGLHPTDEDLARIELPGMHNRHNGYLVLQAIQSVLPNQEYSLLLTTLNRFPGTSRRMEKLAKSLYSDYAHHPTEIRATLQLASEMGNKPVVVYQPHQNVRQHQIQQRYQDCFKNAAKVYWLPTYLTREHKNLETLTAQQLVDQLPDPSNIEAAEMDENLVKKINQHLQDGGTVIVMGAGSIDSWARQNLLR